MATGKTYLVPVDFSRPSEIALDEAVKLSKQNGGKLLLLHVLSDSAMIMAGPDGGTAQMLLEYDRAERENAEERMKKLILKKKLKPGTFKSLIVRRGDPARVIANQAKKSRAAMIVMGSHGRTGLKRLMLGSVAERALRYAACPVLIVKK